MFHYNSGQYLNSPVNQDIWAYSSAGAEYPVEWSTSGVLHDEAEVRILQTDAMEADDVLVL